jgi:tetrahydromethanopterin S-methyltransferase subunit C
MFIAVPTMKPKRANPTFLKATILRGLAGRVVGAAVGQLAVRMVEMDIDRVAEAVAADASCFC